MKWKAALLGAIVIAGVALVAALVPLFECPDCGGYLRTKGKTEEEAREGLRTHRDNLGCPRCGDRGVVSYGNRLVRKGVHPDVGRLARGSIWPYADREGDLEALTGIAQRSGWNPKLVVDWDPSGSLRGFIWRGRFVRTEGKDWFMLASTPTGYSNLETDSPGRILLIDLDGRIADHLDCVILRPKGDFWCFEFYVLPGAAEDGAWIEVFIRESTSARLMLAPFQVTHDGRTAEFRGTESELDPAWRSRGVFRVGVRAGRLAILSPPKAASR